MAEELWRECGKWLIRCEVIPADHRVTWGNAQVIDLATSLRDGVLLCHLLNNLLPGCVDLKEISLRPQMSQFLCLKNIRTFLQTCQASFDVKATDLFEPLMLFDCTDFVQVLHTLSKLSNSSRAQESGIRGFSGKSHPESHDYYNDDIYRNLEDLANDYDDYNCYDEVYTSVIQLQDEDIYEDLCSFNQDSKSQIFLDPPVEKRDYCIRELVETEKNYVEALNMIIRHFIRPMRSIMSSEDEKIVFMNIKDLAEIHAGFHSELVKACTSSTKLSHCFIHWKDKFITYGDYCSNLPKAQDRIDELCAKQELVDQHVARCQMDANEGKFKLRDLLSVPMQRVLKYHLLLKELLRNTPRTHEDYAGLEKALDCMLDIAQFINEVKRDNETLQIIQDIHSSITCLTMPANTELKDYGRLLKDGELKIRSHADNNRMKSRYVFVFDKVLMMCKSIRTVDKWFGGEQYSYKEAIALSDYTVEKIPSKANVRDKWSYMWFLVHREKKQVYTMYAKTEDMKQKWVEAIERALENIHPTECTRSDHAFEMQSFEKPRNCDHCERLLRGVFFQGYQCTTCSVAVHKGCISSVRSCGAPSLPPRPGDNKTCPLGSVENVNQNIDRHPISLCVAKHAHHSTVSGYLSFEQGDLIYVLKKFSSAKWLGRLTRTGQEGWLASENVEEQSFLGRNPRISYEPPTPLDMEAPQSPVLLQQPYVNLNLEEYPWFAGKMSKDTATRQLDKFSEGTFLVRLSERQSGSYAISIKHENKVKHMRVQVDCRNHSQSLYYLSESKYFKSLVELVKWYQENTLADSFTGLNITLLKPFKQVMNQAVPIGFAVVNYDFSATSSNMLSLKKGDHLAILCKRGGDKGWWKGQINNEVGFFPMLYVTESEI